MIPRQTKEHGLKLGEQIEFTDEALHDLIHHYTREAGVRNLEREIATLVRKQARRMAEGKTDKLVVTPEVVREALGIPKFRLEKEVEERVSKPGVSVGLVWTPVGGDIVFIEASKMRGGKGVHDDRASGRGDAGVDAGGAYVGPSELRSLRDRSGLFPQAGLARPRSFGRDSEGRTVGRRRDGNGAGEPLNGTAGAATRGDDRGNFALRNRAADRWREGESARRKAGGHQGSDPAKWRTSRT